MKESVDVLFGLLLLFTVVFGLFFAFYLVIYLIERNRKPTERSSFAIPGSLFLILLLVTIWYVTK